MKILIIGSVAAGTSVAAKARRNSEANEIVIYDKDSDISYAVCGIPYAIGGEVEAFEELTPRDAKWFKKRYNVDIYTGHEVTEINHEKKEIIGRNLLTGAAFTDTYDVLVFATGSTGKTPAIFSEGPYDNVFQVKNISSGKEIQTFITVNRPKTAVVIGAGYIGLEMAEQLVHLGLEVSIIQRSKHPMSHLDWDMSTRIETEMAKQGITFLPEETVIQVNGHPAVQSIVTSTGRELTPDLIILATGVKPNTALAESIGVTLGSTGAIAVSKVMETNISHVFAAGDVAESFSAITKKPIYRPLASTANKMGRIAGDFITNGVLEHRGILGTGILRFFDLTIGQTGLSEKEALTEGFDVVTLFNIKPDRPEYMDGKEMIIKAIANKEDGRLLGVQIIGPQGVDKRIDVFATALSFGAKAADLFHLDLAYAPPFSTTKDPVMYTGMALQNALTTEPLMTPEELLIKQAKNEDLLIIDTRAQKSYEKLHVPNAINIPLGELRSQSSQLDKEKLTIVYCNKGVTGNAAQNILKNEGFLNVYNLSGGNKNYQEIAKHFPDTQISEKAQD